MSFIGYVIVLLIVLYGFHMSFIMGPVGQFLGKIIGDLKIGMLLSAIFTWMIINLIWLFILREDMPILLFVLVFILLMIHPQRRNFVTEEMHQIVAGEQWAIVLVCIYTIFKSETINWI